MTRITFSYFEGIIIILTIIVMILSIYSFRKKNRILISSNIILLFIGFILTVLISSLEKSRIIYNNKILICIILYIISVTVVLFFTVFIKQKHPGSDAIIEAFDKINIGLCYFEDNGRIVLCNEFMHDIFTKLEGTRVLNGFSLQETIKNKSELSSFDDENAYEIVINNRIYLFKINSIIIESLSLKEIKCVDITRYYELREELYDKNSKLIEINKRLAEYGKIADSVIKEQEILNAKIRIHDKFGELLLMTKNTYSKKEFVNSSDNVNVHDIIDSLKNILNLMSMQEEISNNNDFEILRDVAAKIDINIHLDGNFPSDNTKSDLFLLAIRECITNTYKHARGHNIYISIINSNINQYILKITNDGKMPISEIILGTGLSSLKSKIEQADGIFKITCNPEFCLEIKL